MLSKKSLYYLKSVLFFASRGKESFSIKEVSEKLFVSEKVLEQILLGLKNAGVLTSKRGPRGGYCLAKDVYEMSVLDVIRLAKENTGIFRIRSSTGDRVIDTVVEEIEDGIDEDMRKQLGETKIKNLVLMMRQKVTEIGLSYVI